MTEETKEVKKRGRPKGSKAPPKTKEALENQKQGQLKKGDVNNLGGARSFRKPTLEFRQKCHSMVSEHGIAMLVNLMCDAYENNKPDEALDIIKWLASMAYGTPKPMETYPEEPETKSSQFAPILVLDRVDIMDAMESDNDYN